MMKALTFRLSGRTAFFRKPDVNSYAYFTYNNIHKIALLGIIGAIIGLGGHLDQYDKKSNFPKFYEKLKDIKIGIEPLSKHGVFTKKIQAFNNSVGYASKEEGGNLIVREQWLENPAWNIYMQLEGYKGNKPEAILIDKIYDYFSNSKCEYIPYLGKNDHYADIKGPKLVEVEHIDKTDHIDTLFPIEETELGNMAYDFLLGGENAFFFKEIAPFSFNKEVAYGYKEMCKTNLTVISKSDNLNSYIYEDKVIVFY